MHKKGEIMLEILYFIKKYIKDFIFALLIIVCICLSCYSIFFKEEKSFIKEDSVFLANNDIDNSNETNKEIKKYVDIKGEIKNPGVYEFEEGMIVNDIVSLAGGFTDNASSKNLNLSKKVTDEMVIYVYSQKELENNFNNNTNKETACISNEYNIEDCISKKESIIISKGENTDDNLINSNNTQDDNNESSIININTASKDQLTTLTGIGEAKAQAIIDYRNTNGNFKNIDELLNVNGIGDAIFAKIKDYITV